MSGRAHQQDLDQVRAFVTKHRKPSASFISRNLGIGYAAAERALKQLAKEGLVEGPYFNAPPFRMAGEG